MLGTGTLVHGQPGHADTLSGVIRIWGHGSLQEDYIGALVSAWESGFSALHPGVSFVHTLRGNDSAIGGLYTGAADIALMERGMIAIELDAYQPIFKTDPFELSVATGSVDVPHHANPLTILVHRANPLASLTLAQLDAVFGAAHRRGTRTIRRWGELGLAGAWAGRPINVYVPSLDEEEAQYFEKVVMQGSRKWTGGLREFHATKQGKDKVASGAQRAAEVLAHDRYGIALSTTRFLPAGSKALALATTDGGQAAGADRASVSARRYPLTRALSMFVNRAPNQPIDRKIKEFLDYVLSDEGQAMIDKDGGYYRLPPDLARLEKEKLQ